MLINYELACRTCSHKEELKLDATKVGKWKNGALIQNMFPELTLDQRELMISRTCPTCWKKLFGEPEANPLNDPKKVYLDDKGVLRNLDGSRSIFDDVDQ